MRGLPAVEPGVLGRFLESLFSRDELLPAIEVLRGGLGANAAELWLLDRTSRELLLAVFSGDDRAAFTSRARFELGTGFPGIAAGSVSPLVTQDLPADPRFLRTLVPSSGYRSVACVPIERSGQVAGALELSWKATLPDAALPTLASTVRPMEARLASETLASIRSVQWPFQGREAPAAWSVSGRHESGLLAPQLEVFCLGGFEVTLFGRALAPEDFGRSKAIEILQLLAIQEGRSVQRDQLIGALWPGLDDKRGTNRFHVAMTALRHAIEPEGSNVRFIRRDGDAYRLDEAAPVRVDLWELRRLAARATAAPGRFSPRERIEALEQAVALYTGDLFGGRGPARAAGTAESLRILHVDLLVELARMLVEAHSNRAVVLLRQAVTLDPGREDVERELIKAGGSGNMGTGFGCGAAG